MATNKLIIGTNTADNWGYTQSTINPDDLISQMSECFYGCLMPEIAIQIFAVQVLIEIKDRSRTKKNRVVKLFCVPAKDSVAKQLIDLASSLMSAKYIQ